MPNFDPETFMQQTIDAPLETEYALVPEGEYRATIDDFTSEAFEQIDFTYKKGQRAGQPGTMTKFSCPFVIQDDAVKAEMGRDKVVVTKQINLDFDETGGIAKGKNRNIELGRVMSACGLNAQGSSVSQLRGAGPVMVKVVHREGERKDGSKWKRAEVDAVAAIR